jgi:hypothetical protein
MQVRGREERAAFVNTFHDIFVFQTEHDKGLVRDLLLSACRLALGP